MAGGHGAGASPGLGELSEASIVLALLRHDLTVLRPYGDSQRYDLVVEQNERFFRVQCKTGRLSRGSDQVSNVQLLRAPRPRQEGLPGASRFLCRVLPRQRQNLPRAG